MHLATVWEVFVFSKQYCHVMQFSLNNHKWKYQWDRHKELLSLRLVCRCSVCRACGRKAHYWRGELTVFPDEHMRRRISWQPRPLTIASWSSVTEVGSSLFNLELSWDTPNTSPLKTGIQTDSSFWLQFPPLHTVPTFTASNENTHCNNLIYIWQ